MVAPVRTEDMDWQNKYQSNQMNRRVLNRKKTVPKALFVIGVGILLVTLPTLLFADYADFFRFLGIGLILGGIVYQFLLRYPQNIFISEEEIPKHKKVEQISIPKTVSPKLSVNAIVFILIIAGFILNQILIWKTVLSRNSSKPFSVSINITRKNGK